MRCLSFCIIDNLISRDTKREARMHTDTYKKRLQNNEDFLFPF